MTPTTQYLVMFDRMHPRTGLRCGFETLEAEAPASMAEVVALLLEGTKDTGDQRPVCVRVIYADLAAGIAYDATEAALMALAEADPDARWLDEYRPPESFDSAPRWVRVAAE